MVGVQTLLSWTMHWKGGFQGPQPTWFSVQLGPMRSHLVKHWLSLSCSRWACCFLCLSCQNIQRFFFLIFLSVHQALIDMMFYKERTENGLGFQHKNSTRPEKHMQGICLADLFGAVKPSKGVRPFQCNVSSRDWSSERERCSRWGRVVGFPVKTAFLPTFSWGLWHAFFYNRILAYRRTAARSLMALFF